MDQDTASTSNPMNQTEMDKSLIVFVRQNTTIWDRNCNTYPNKHVKSQLWDSIAARLNLKTNACMLRWKALREKYIRQRVKFQHEGEKWELLDELSFLDKVIQYRKKQSDDTHYQKTNSEIIRNNSPPSMTTQQATSHLLERKNNFSQITLNYETEDESSLNESNDFGVKEESMAIEVADSSCYSNTTRKRLSSTHSEAASEKREKTDDTVRNPKSPEDLFGDLVAAMLTRKPEKDRNFYMIEIMRVLSK
ncbi:uncharacterized protein [Leptinotarsa decemlineata]|uniref:uncharacterized protein n=1 Tax=Leptinotarsa decemlineata TaxID=7539 RepID=UPI003D3069EC